jgi:hypothetical protein
MDRADRGDAMTRDDELRERAMPDRNVKSEGSAVLRWLTVALAVGVLLVCLVLSYVMSHPTCAYMSCWML